LHPNNARKIIQLKTAQKFEKNTPALFILMVTEKHSSLLQPKGVMKMHMLITAQQFRRNTQFIAAQKCEKNTLAYCIPKLFIRCIRGGGEKPVRKPC
jgi:hypothetical protein